jgi:hypothetical protein
VYDANRKAKALWKIFFQSAIFFLQVLQSDRRSTLTCAQVISLWLVTGERGSTLMCAQVISLRLVTGERRDIYGKGNS